MESGGLLNTFAIFIDLYHFNPYHLYQESTMKHSFGGRWTEDKLGRLRKYLSAYMTIFSSNERAKKYLQPIYVDAFAGTGYRSDKEYEEDVLYLSEFAADDEGEEFRKGSARIALEVTPQFARYVFIETNRYRAETLDELRNQFPTIKDRIDVHIRDANSWLREWCKMTDWQRTRAVVFLDPYGMQVEWETLDILAATKAIDLWILFPLMPVNRLLTRTRVPEGAIAERISMVFGTDQWKELFYSVVQRLNLFDEEDVVIVKDADFRKINSLFNERLGSIFAKVASTPYILRNSKNSPLYSLFFATANPRAAETAVRIANHILKN